MCGMMFVIKLYILMMVFMAVAVFILKKILFKQRGQAADTKTCPSGHKCASDARFCQTCGKYIEISGHNNPGK